MTDGNAWWGDTYFNTEKWVRGLGYMVAHVGRLPIFINYSANYSHGIFTGEKMVKFHVNLDP